MATARAVQGPTAPASPGSVQEAMSWVPPMSQKLWDGAQESVLTSAPSDSDTR